MLLDVLGSHTLQLHGAIDNPLSIDNHLAMVPAAAQATAAHVATGWDHVQQQFGLTGKGQTVAVIDSGIAWDHVSLGKGFGPGYRVVGGWDFTEENDANPYDDGPSGFHGTHVAGIIGSDDSKYSGVAPGVDLVALRVFNDAGQGQLNWVEKALQWVHSNRNAFENPITTVNLSIGTTWNASSIPSGAILEDELRQLFNDGIVVTASAGNSFKQYNAPGLSYPAASPYVIPVASVDDNGQLSDFSQRNDRVIAAPGRNIMSTVPDHLLGRDGKVNDFSTASGTSMAAPYVAGASVLVRQAMEMAGWSNINASSLAHHLSETADRVFDALTNASYDRLDLQQAIDAIIPDDNVGDQSSTAQPLNFASGKLSGWINSLNDVDVYRFNADAAGTWGLDADSDWADSLRWTVSTQGQTLGSGDLRAADLKLLAGQSYELRVESPHNIGPFQLNWTFQADPQGTSPSPSVTTDIGAVSYWENEIPAGQTYRAQATQDGIFSVLWQNPDAQTGALRVLNGASTLATDTTWEGGELRVDIQARAGQWFDIQMPGNNGDRGELAIANVVTKIGTTLQVNGTSESDVYKLNLKNGVDVAIGEMHYRYAAGQIQNLQIDGRVGNDQIQITGSSAAESVKMTPTQTTLESNQLNVRIQAVEQVALSGGGGADGVYLYDTDTDDQLVSRPRQAEMTGAGYKYSVTDVDRIFIHATAGGQDIAYLYDSAGDDRLSVRPQFTSLTGAGYFNYISGFERVYAYGNAGGFDTADIYDSQNNDRFSTSGDAASITGPGFASYTKFFEQVNAYATAGGQDVAMLYGSSKSTQWQQGADFINFRESTWSREARGFQSVETYVSGQPISLAVNSLSASAASPTTALASNLIVAAAVAASSSAEAVHVGPVTAPQSTTLSSSQPLPHQTAHHSSLDFSQPHFSEPLFAEQPRDGAYQDLQGSSRQEFATDNQRENAAELALLADVTELQSWLNDEGDWLTDDGAWLTDAGNRTDDSFFNDPGWERKVLDEIFGRSAGDSLL